MVEEPVVEYKESNKQLIFQDEHFDAFINILNIKFFFKNTFFCPACLWPNHA